MLSWQINPFGILCFLMNPYRSRSQIFFQILLKNAPPKKTYPLYKWANENCQRQLLSQTEGLWNRILSCLWMPLHFSYPDQQFLRFEIPPCGISCSFYATSPQWQRPLNCVPTAIVTSRQRPVNLGRCKRSQLFYCKRSCWLEEQSQK